MFARGLLIGLSIAAPVGPIGVLCIQRTLRDGRLIGFLSGLGAATADGMYGAVAAFGLTAISGPLLRNQTPMRLIGGILLIALGIRTILRRAEDERPAAGRARSAAGAYLSTLALTVTNPLTILSFAAVFAGLGLIQRTAAGATLLVAGVFLGSALWWLTLTTITGIIRRRMTPETMTWVNRVSGTVITAFGVIALLSLA